MAYNAKIPTLVDNLDDNTVLNALKQLLPFAQALDVSTGTFEIGSLLARWTMALECSEGVEEHLGPQTHGYCSRRGLPAIGRRSLKAGPNIGGRGFFETSTLGTAAQRRAQAGRS